LRRICAVEYSERRAGVRRQNSVYRKAVEQRFCKAVGKISGKRNVVIKAGDKAVPNVEIRVAVIVARAKPFVEKSKNVDKSDFMRNSNVCFFFKHLVFIRIKCWNTRDNRECFRARTKVRVSALNTTKHQ